MKHNFGIHLTIDIENCDAKKLVDNKFIYALLNNLPTQFSMKLLTPPYIIEYKDNWAKIAGLTGFTIIAESHISIHTFPEQKYAFVDIFSCKHFDVNPIANKIIKMLGSNKATKNIVERGKNFMITQTPLLRVN